MNLDELAADVTDISEMLSKDEFAARIRKANKNASDNTIDKMYAQYKKKVAEELLSDDEDALEEAMVKRRSLKSRLAAAKNRRKPMDAKRKAKAKAAKLWRRKNKAKIKAYKKRYKAPTRKISNRRESIEQAIKSVTESGDVEEAVNALLANVVTEE